MTSDKRSSFDAWAVYRMTMIVARLPFRGAGIGAKLPPVVLRRIG
jgi:hypothetical protein